MRKILIILFIVFALVFITSEKHFERNCFKEGNPKGGGEICFTYGYVGINPLGINGRFGYIIKIGENMNLK